MGSYFGSLIYFLAANLTLGIFVIDKSRFHGNFRITSRGDEKSKVIAFEESGKLEILDQDLFGILARYKEKR